MTNTKQQQMVLTISKLLNNTSVDIINKAMEVAFNNFLKNKKENLLREYENNKATLGVSKEQYELDLDAKFKRWTNAWANLGFQSIPKETWEYVLGAMTLTYNEVSKENRKKIPNLENKDGIIIFQGDNGTECTFVKGGVIENPERLTKRALANNCVEYFDVPRPILATIETSEKTKELIAKLTK